MDPKILKKFSEMSRKIITFAQKIAQNSKSAINSEHILLSLASIPNTFAYEILSDHTINVDRIKLTLDLKGPESKLSAGISLNARKILELSLKTAVDFKNTFVNPEHILYAIVISPECSAYQIINRIGINPKTIQGLLDSIFNDIHHLKNTNIEKRIQDDFNKILEISFAPLFELKHARVGTLEPPNHRNRENYSGILEKFAINLVDLAKKNQLDPVAERDIEANRTMQILGRRTKNNPILVGDPGVGKTAIVELIAQKIASGKAPIALANKIIWQLDLSAIVAGTTFRGQFEERINAIIKEVVASKNMILFIDEFHTVVGAGNAEGSMDASNILKPALAKGRIRLIGATTENEYREYIERDPAFARRMQRVYIDEPDIEKTINILNILKKRYEEYHNVSISNEVIKFAVITSQKFITDRFFPDKAIDVIDEAASSKNISALPNPRINILHQLEKKLNSLIKQKELAIKDQNFDEAAKYRTLELATLSELNNKKISQKSLNLSKRKITENDVAKVISLWTNIPMENILAADSKDLLTISNRLKSRVYGQNEIIDQIVKIIKRAKSGINRTNKPLGSCLFLGGSGTGKTYLAQKLAEELLGDENDLIRIDMSEFMEKHNISRLIGAPPGYIGYEDRGELTEAIRTKPHSIVLFDEIEKAHPDVANILLQILDNGVLTDATGKKVNFNQTIIIVTSNVGSEKLGNISQTKLGFRDQNTQKINVHNKKSEIIEEMKTILKPELLNRFDMIGFFNPLNDDAKKQIIRLWFENLNLRLPEGKIIRIKESEIKKIANYGYKSSEGARSIIRFLTDIIENEVIDCLVSNKTNDKINININKQSISLELKNVYRQTE